MIDLFDIRRDRPAKRIQQQMDKETDRSEKNMVAVMHRLVTEERAKLGKGPVHIDRCELADRMASGHIDYRLKAALYAEDIVMDRGVNWRDL